LQRLGLKDISISSDQARLGPITLKTSEEMRLRRLARNAIVKDEPSSSSCRSSGESIRPRFLVGFLRELIPPIPAEMPVAVGSSA